MSGLPCQSTKPVSVTVATIGGMVTTNHPLTVARTRALAVGEAFVTGASGDIGCNELPAGGSYLVSVFNGGTSTSGTVRFELRGSAGGPLASRLPAGGGITIDAARAPSIARTRASAAEEAHLDHLDADLAVLRRLGAPRRRALAPSYSRAGTPPVPLTVGTTAPLKFHYSSCGANGISPVTARVVFVGSRSVVLEDVAGPLAGQIDADLIAMAQEFETVSYPLLLNFGDPLARDASTDVNGRILMLFTPKVNALGTNLLGFVSACDLYPVAQDPSVAGSNEAEIFYARTVTDIDDGHHGAERTVAVAAADAGHDDPRGEAHHLVRRAPVARRDAVRAGVAGGGDGAARERVVRPRDPRQRVARRRDVTQTV